MISIVFSFVGQILGAVAALVFGILGVVF